MIRIGNFFFRLRNGLFPLVYLLLLIDSPRLFADLRIAALVGFLVALSGQLLRAGTIGLEYILRGGRNREVYAEQLVQGGIFAHCRNPLYVGNFVIVLGLAIASNSVLFLSVGVPFFFFAYWAIIAAEENFLRNKFGSEFEDYCRRVNRIVPRVAGLGQTLTGMRFNWSRLVSAEYGTAFVWVAVLILVTLANLWRAGEYDVDQVLIHTLWALFALAAVFYLIARILKKTGRLAGRNATSPAEVSPESGT